MSVDLLEKPLGEGLELARQLMDHHDMHGPEFVDEHLDRLEDLRRKLHLKAFEIVLAAETSQEPIDRLNDAAESAHDPRPALHLRERLRKVQDEKFSRVDG
jgi:hypothetical protein